MRNRPHPQQIRGTWLAASLVVVLSEGDPHRSARRSRLVIVAGRAPSQESVWNKEDPKSFVIKKNMKSSEIIERLVDATTSSRR
ncbi:hypothetical protein T265_16224, partial [Opisthorchis viverrini]